MNKVKAFVVVGLLSLAATVLSAATPFHNITAPPPNEVSVLVVQVDVGVCQFIEYWGNPCVQHITVMLFPHTPGSTYKVTVNYSQPLISKLITQSKRASNLDNDGMVSVVFLTDEAVLQEVIVEKVLTVVEQVSPVVEKAARKAEERR